MADQQNANVMYPVIVPADGVADPDVLAARPANPDQEQLREKLRALEGLGVHMDSIAGAFENLAMEDGMLVLKPGQMQKIRDDQVENSVGGFVFAVSDVTRVRRFLILGSSGGTFYATEKELTIDNVSALIEIINAGHSAMILKEILEISLAGRNPKQEPIMLALALCARYRVHDCTAVTDKEPQAVRNYAAYLNATHQAALAMVNHVCRIPTHLFMFVEFCEQIAKQTNTFGVNKSTGWGRSFRRAITNWYATKTPEQLAVHVTKYKQRNGWSHRDLFRLAHPVSKEHKKSSEQQTLEIEQIYHFVVKGSLKTRKRRLTDAEFAVEQPLTKYSVVQLDTEEASKALNMLDSVLTLNAETPEEDVVKAIKEHKLVREHIPTEHLNSIAVWHALLEKMPMTAMIRNLGKLTNIKALTGDYVAKVVSELTDENKLKSNRVHPIQILLAQTIYQAGNGAKGSLTWEPVPAIEVALEDAFYKSFINAPATGKRFCMALDVSGSMTATISNTMLSCRAASAALSLVSLRNEKHVECVGFCDNLVELPYRGDWTIKKITDHMNGLPFGRTDCALPMLWAMEKKKKFDVFIVYTDCETYFGEVHPFVALRQYREASGIHDAKLIVMGMTATNFTIADPTDAGMLDIVGFDSAVPTLLNDFVTGQL